MTSCKVLGQRLRRFVKSKRAYKILDLDPSIAGSTWMSGGCLLLAKALTRVLPNARLRGLYTAAQLQHAVVQIGHDCFLDGDGGSTAEQLQRRWLVKEGLPNTHIGPWSPERAQRGGITCPVIPMRVLERELRKALAKRARRIRAQ